MPCRVLKRQPRLASVRYWRDSRRPHRCRGRLRAFRSNAEIVAPSCAGSGVRHRHRPDRRHLRHAALVDARSRSRADCSPRIARAWHSGAGPGRMPRGRQRATSIRAGSCCISMPALHGLTLTADPPGAGRPACGDRESFPTLGVEPLLRAVRREPGPALRRVQPLRSAARRRERSRRCSSRCRTGWRGVDAGYGCAAGAESRGRAVHAPRRAPRISRRAWAAACEPLLQKLRSRISARGPHVLQVHHRLADFPGVLEALLRLPGTEVHVLEPGAAAPGPVQPVPDCITPVAGLAVLTELPWDRPPAERPSETCRPEALPEQPPTPSAGRAPGLSSGRAALPHRQRSLRPANTAWRWIPACAACPGITARCASRTVR